MATTISGSGITTGSLDTSAEAISPAELGNGCIIQVVQSVKSDLHEGTAGAGTYEDIDGTDQNGSGSVWCCKITPTTATNKILVDVNVCFGTSNWAMFFNLYRDSPILGQGYDATGNRSRSTFAGAGDASGSADNVGNASFKYLDSPSSTSELTYKIQGSHRGGSLTWKINRSNIGGNYNYVYTTSSVITLMEVVA